jgi:hypothetical protein
MTSQQQRLIRFLRVQSFQCNGMKRSATGKYFRERWTANLVVFIRAKRCSEVGAHGGGGPCHGTIGTRLIRLSEAKHAFSISGVKRSQSQSNIRKTARSRSLSHHASPQRNTIKNIGHIKSNIVRAEEHVVSVHCADWRFLGANCKRPTSINCHAQHRRNNSW